MKCPVCNDEYTITPVRNKTGSLVCQACGWRGDGFSPWGTVFDKDRWLESRADLARILERYAFTSTGFPVDELMGSVAAKGNVLLCRGESPRRRFIVEQLFGQRERPPEWLDCDSTGKPRSSMTSFHAWLHNDGRDAAYVCDSLNTAFRVMEAWWPAEGRFPDIAWMSCHGNAPVQPKGGAWLDGRHVFAVGSESLVKTLQARGTAPSAWIRTERRLVPDELYLSCRKMEDIANDPGNTGDTVELQVAHVKRNSFEWTATTEYAGRCYWKKLREVQKKRPSNGRVPPLVQKAEKPGRRGEGEAAG